MGRTKALEQAGDWQRLAEYLIHLSQANGDHETAAELRAQLNPSPPAKAAYTAGPEFVKPHRNQRKKPARSTHQQKVNRAWEELRLRRGV